MADLRLWSRELITELIEKYKSFPCLWKVKCEVYRNKYLKSTAYKELVEFCKSRGFPDATRDFVVRKLQSLRGSFRKELRKTRQHRRMGKTYQSNLWYYKNLLFTKDQELETSHADDGKQSDDETCQSTEDTFEVLVQVEDEEKYLVAEKPSMTVELETSDADDGNESEDETCHSAEDASEVVEVEDEEKYLVAEKPSTTVSNYTSDSPQSPKSLYPKKRTAEDFPQLEFFDICEETSKFKDLSEFELTGMSIAKKLARMDATQAIYAESIINSVIRKGLLKKLKEETDLCDNLCGKRVLTVSCE